MPSKQANERFIRADRRNQLEKVRLEHRLRIFDRERSNKALEIDREKKYIVKSFDFVKRTSGRSDQGVAPSDKNDNDFLSAPVYRMGLRLSDRRLMEWRNREVEDKKFHHFESLKKHKLSNTLDYYNNGLDNHNFTSSSEKLDEDDVFSDAGSLQDLSFDVKSLTKQIMESYTSLFSQNDFKLDKANIKRIRSGRFCRSMSDIDSTFIQKSKPRPQTASISDRRHRSNSSALPRRPATASAYMTSRNNQSNKSKNTIHSIPSSLINNYISDSDSEFTDDNESVDINSNIGDFKNEKSNFKEDKRIVLSKTSSTGQRKNSNRHCDLQNTEPIPEDQVLTTQYMQSNAETIPEERILTTTNTQYSSETSDINKQKRRVSYRQRKPSTSSFETIKEDSIVTQINQSDIADSSSDISRVTNEPSMQKSNSRDRRLSSSRERRMSGSTATSEGREQNGNMVGGSVFSSMSDLSLDSNGQRRPSKWREFVAAENAPIPITKSIVSVSTVVRAALAFSKTARKRALTQLVQEQSTDANEIIRQERLRRLDSKNSILAAISKNF